MLTHGLTLQNIIRAVINPIKKIIKKKLLEVIATEELH